MSCSRRGSARAAHAAVAKQASYGTVYKVYSAWRSARTAPPSATVPSQPSLALVTASDGVDEAVAAPQPSVEIASADTSSGELALESVALP